LFATFFEFILTLQGRKLLVIGTTSNKRVLAEMGMMDVFSSTVLVENLTRGEEVSII
jgi:hypothetical protein